MVDPYEEELKELKCWRCYLCDFEDKSRNGLKAHLSMGTHNKNNLLLTSQTVFPDPPHKVSFTTQDRTDPRPPFIVLLERERKRVFSALFALPDFWT